jgi:hypothetical protein
MILTEPDKPNFCQQTEWNITGRELLLKTFLSTNLLLAQELFMPKHWKLIFHLRFNPLQSGYWSHYTEIY